LAALEFPETLALIAELASTDLGREGVLAIEPVREEDLAVRRGRFEEVARLAAAEMLVPAVEEALGVLGGELGRARPEIDGKALLVWGRVLEISGQVVNRVRAAEGLSQLPEDVAELADLDWLARRIRETLDERGEVRDDASPRLAKLRRRVTSQRQATYSGLRKALDAHAELFSEDTMPLHNGRLVLMLRSSDRGRAAGLVHGHSGSGRSLYFEPLAVVDSNNALQETIGEEEVERRRLLAELREAVLAESEALRSHLDLVADVDALQAAWRFGELCGCRLAELSTDDLILCEARHPLLDRASRDLRLSSLGALGHEGAVTPLDLELDQAGRVLVITGPNAGGKTVALKTTGLLVALNQSGLPVPAAAGTRLPVVTSLVAVVGDEQDLMRDRSTFSGRLLRLKEAWSSAGSSSLILLDELGSGTDPQEGAALAQALLERLAGTGSAALVTTHLLELASAALELAGATCAAMEFDRETGRPTYRLLAGPPGGSEAIALARQLELPEEWLDRATALIGPEHRSLAQILAEVEGLRGELEDEQVELAKLRRAAERQLAAAEREREDLAAERRSLGKKQHQELKEFRRRVRDQLAEEVEKLRGELEAGRRKGLASKATERLFADAPEVELQDEGLPLTVGSAVRHRDYSWQGVVDSIDGDTVDVVVHGKRLRCSAGALIGVEVPETEVRGAKIRVEHESRDVPDELKLIGRRVEEALDEVDGYLDRAVLAGLPRVRLIHGHGSGRLRKALRAFLGDHPSVAGFEPGGQRDGGDGATVVKLRL
jgi:DNA mismatch repair protein MutS2